MSNWLLKIGFAGVQEFIGQARKTRDLAAGSALLSGAMRQMLQSLGSSLGAGITAEVLLPHDPSKEYLACPHQTVIQVQSATEDRIRALAERLATTLRQAIVEPLAKHVEGASKNGVPSAFVSDAGFCKRQIEDAFEIYWVAAAASAPKPTADDFRGIQKLFDDRRHTRTFRQLETPKSDPWMCAQCGSRVAVVAKKSGPEKLAAWHGDLFSKRDHLCAVCLGRRLWSAKRFPKFPSTVRLSWDRLFRPPWHNVLGTKRPSDEKLAELFDRWEEFEEARQSGGDAPQGVDEGTWEHFRGLSGDDGFHQALRAASPYYAVAAFDGDRMGKWFSGEFFQDGTGLFAGHEVLGRGLAAFSHALKDWFLKDGFHANPERLVYAGGDDGLVLLPLDDLLPFLAGLHDLWQEKVCAAPGLVSSVRTDPGTDAPILPTLTCHAAVVHRWEPLQPVVRRLHEDLVQTKERVRGRNAFSLRTDVRGGASELMLAPWGQRDAFNTAVAALAGPLPGRLSHQLLASAEGFFDPDGGCVHPGGLQRELARVGQRGQGGTAAPSALVALVRWLAEDRAGVTSWGSGWAEPNPEGFEPLSASEAFRTAVAVSGFLGREMGRGS